MTINNPAEFVNNLWDWAILEGCFGETRIMPTDIDGLIERNGKFFVIETKSPGVEITTGQMITFKHMIDTGYFTIALIWGEPGKPKRIVLMTRQTTLEYNNADINRLRQIVSSWFIWANNTPMMGFSE